MKNIIFKTVFISVLCLFFIAKNVHAQNEKSTEISYKVDFGPVYPIEGESSQLVGNLGLDDVTGELQSMSFSVPLISFLGTHAGYLAWVGNSWYNPDMEFKSKSVTIKDDHWEVSGTLEFRRKFMPVKINVYRKDTKNEIVLEGDFQMNTRDYFIISPPLDLVPAWIPFKMIMVFDKLELSNKGAEIKSN